MPRILVTDDRAASRELIRSMLESAGYQVDEAENGLEALKIIQQNPPDLVLLDLQMPLMDGFGLVRELRERNLLDKVLVVALTASAMQGDSERAIQEGFSGYITKPVRLGELRNQLGRLLNP